MLSRTSAWDSTPGIFFRLTLTIFLSSYIQDTLSCSVNSCNARFVSNTKQLSKGAFYPYCKELDTYMKCVEAQATNCHGNLLYHGTKISVETLLLDNNCKEVLENQLPLENESRDISEKKPSEFTFRTNNDIQSADNCGYYGDPQPAHCGLFGDPHLKTFNGSLVTCRVQGAWPLISSSYLSVQVTNEQVGLDSLATATTKVTVLINGQEQCGREKTYEASMEELPKAFVDGTTYSGLENRSPYAQVREVLPGSHVLIDVLKINATVTIRRVGKYLTVSATLPREIVDQIRKEGDIQLCEEGCPQSEHLNFAVFGGDHLPVMNEAKAKEMCSEMNITDFFLDSCVFDLVTTGDPTFRDAAFLAQQDMWASSSRTQYSFMKNCTVWPCTWKAYSGGHCNRWSLFYIISLLHILFVDYFWHIRAPL